jgi:hypothetical protein
MAKEIAKGFEKVKNLREDNIRPTNPAAGKKAAAVAVKAYDGIKSAGKPKGSGKTGMTDKRKKDA